jgi:hypothetical protein
VYYLGLGDRSAYNLNRSWYGLIHMMKAWNVPSDTIHHVNDCSWGKPRTFLLGTANVLGENFERSERNKDDWLRQLGLPSIVSERITNVCFRLAPNIPRITGNVQEK